MIDPSTNYYSKYPDIPIVDVHIHVGGTEVIVNDSSDIIPPVDIMNYIEVSKLIKQTYGSNLAFWISMNDPKESGIEMKRFANYRILFSLCMPRPHKGLNITADEVIAKIEEGYVGLKIWFSDPSRVLQDGEEGITHIDNPRYESFFSQLESGDVLLTSFHIAEPNGPYGNRQLWMPDPVYFWSQIRAFENVVAKYPKLNIVAAHCAWLVCQDAQIDYLRYLLSTYPNLYVDTAATFQYMHLVDRDNLRDFYIEYQDRILYGTDCGLIEDHQVPYTVYRYSNTFAILETNQTIQGGFFGNNPIKGLNLPRAVLEKIYYRNAIKLYPGLNEAMGLEDNNVQSVQVTDSNITKKRTRVDIYDYLTNSKLFDLCKEIKLPDEVTESILNHVNNDDFHAVNYYFITLFSPKTVWWSIEKIEKLCSDNGKPIDHGLKIMAVLLAAALHTRELYAKAGIDDSIYIQTMSVFYCSVKDFEEIHGVYGFDRALWCCQHLSLNTFRLGTLEFEKRIVSNPSDFGFHRERSIPVLWVHIPSNALMTREELDNSYKTAHTFFNHYYPDFKYRCLCCGAWLLSPILKEILPSDSRILTFQSDFKITKLFHDDESYFIRVFKQEDKPDDLSQLPENTSLQRIIKKHLLEGGMIGRAEGVISY